MAASRIDATVKDRPRSSDERLLQIDDHDDRRLDRRPKGAMYPTQTATLMWNSGPA